MMDTSKATMVSMMNVKGRNCLIQFESRLRHDISTLIRTEVETAILNNLCRTHYDEDDESGMDFKDLVV